jgi:hypothetical protein
MFDIAEETKFVFVATSLQANSDEVTLSTFGAVWTFKGMFMFRTSPSITEFAFDKMGFALFAKTLNALLNMTSTDNFLASGAGNGTVPICKTNFFRAQLAGN